MQYAQSLTRSPGPVAQDLPGISISYYDTDVETIKGQTVTERDIHDWANEAERGYDVEQLRRRGRKPIGDGPASVVPVRIDSGLLAELNERAERDHVSRSEVIRAAIRSYVG
jgi:hypothetical protein